MEANQNIRYIGGTILVLFGIYRISLYRIKSKRYNFMDEDRFEDEYDDAMGKSGNS